MTYLDPVRALRIIEGLVHDMDDDPLLTAIYEVAHQAGSPECAKNHSSFATRALELENELVQRNIIHTWDGPADYKPIGCTITVNGQIYEFLEKEITYWQLVELAFAHDFLNNSYSIAYQHGPDGIEGILSYQQTVPVCNGMQFNIALTDKA